MSAVRWILVGAAAAALLTAGCASAADVDRLEAALAEAQAANAALSAQLEVAEIPQGPQTAVSDLGTEATKESTVRRMSASACVEAEVALQRLAPPSGLLFPVGRPLTASDGERALALAVEMLDSSCDEVLDTGRPVGFHLRNAVRLLYRLRADGWPLPSCWPSRIDSGVPLREGCVCDKWERGEPLPEHCEEDDVELWMEPFSWEPSPNGEETR
ncbi:MAG: hypothetical protein OXF61_02845 [Acidimicrobiaceae bacterium]|nr:hypothetical protein [Acidimicrobiaceae bacterium]